MNGEEARILRAAREFTPNPLGAVRREHMIAAALLLAMCLAFFAHILLSGQVLYGWDIVNEKYYWRRWAFWEQMLRGRMPLWNPHTVSGYAFAADPIQMVFYPLNIVFVLFPTRIAFTVSFMMHFWMLGFFMYLMLRALGRSFHAGLIGAAAVAFSATMVARVFLGDHPHFSVIAWFPMAVFLIERAFQTRRRRYYLWLGVVNAMGVFGGHPQYTFYFFVGSGLYMVFRTAADWIDHRQGRWVAAHLGLYASSLVLAAALCAVLLLPEIESIVFSNKSAGYPEHLAAMFSYPPENLLTFLMPWVYGDLVTTGYWGKGVYSLYAQYVGVLPLLLAALGLGRKRDRHVWFFLGLGLGAALYSMGRYTPVFHYLFKYAPGFDMLRFAPRSMFLVTITLGLLAACGWDAFVEAMESGRERLFRALKLFAGLAGAAAALWVLALVFSNALAPAWSRFLGSVVYNIPHEHTWLPDLGDPAERLRFFGAAVADLGRFALLLGAGTGLLWFLAVRRPRRLIFHGLALCFVFLNLFCYGRRYLIPIPEEQLLFEPGVVRFLNERSAADGPHRIATLTPLAESDLPPRVYEFFSRLNHYNQSYINRGMAAGVSHFGGELGLLSQRYIDLAGMPGEEFTYAIYKLMDMDLMDLLNVRFVLVPRGAVDDYAEYVSRAPEFERLAPEWYLGRTLSRTVPVPVGEYESEKLYILESPTVLPRVYMARVWEAAETEAQARGRLLSAGPMYRSLALGVELMMGLQAPGLAGGLPAPAWAWAGAQARGAAAFSLRQASPFMEWAVLDADPGLPEPGAPAPAPAARPPRVISYEPNEVRVHVHDPLGGMLVLLDTYYPGWKAYVNGRETPALRANYVFRAVPLPPGEHTVVFRFEPGAMILGWRITAAGIMLTAAILILVNTPWWARRRRRRLREDDW